VRRLPILALLSASAISTVGSVMALVAIPWFVLETTGSPGKTGLTGAAIVLGTILAGIFGGPFVDRLGFKRSSVVSDLMSGLTVALVPLLHSTVGLAFWQLLVLVFLASLLGGPGNAARFALLPDLASHANMPIERANSAYQTIPRISQFLGPPLAGVLIATIGASNILWLDSATFGVSALLVAALVPANASPSANEKGGNARGYWTELLRGLRFVRGNPLVLSMILVVAFTNFLAQPLVAVVMPVYARQVFDSAVALGLMLGSFGAGAVAGTIAFGFVGHRLPRLPTFLLSFFSGGPLSYFVLAMTPPLPIVVGGFALAGFLMGPLNPLIATVIQENTPREMLGRVRGVLTALGQAGMPLGVLLGGFLVEGVGLLPTTLGMGICYLLVTISACFNPALRGMDAAEEASPRRF
jgi:MFS family permease